MTDKEEPFELELTLIIPGYGKQIHRRQLAQKAKKILEVSMHKEIQVILNESDGSWLVNFDQYLSDIEIREPTVSEVVAGVEQVLDVSLADLKSSSRAKHISYARQVCCYLLYTLVPNLSYPQIGKLLKKDQSSVRTGSLHIGKLLKTDQNTLKVVSRITELVRTV